MSRLVKICGLTDPENIREVIQLRPDWIGLIFYPGSPRFIPDATALQFINELPDKPLTVGVFVNPDIREIMKTSEILRLDVIQLHGTESPAFCDEVKEEGFIVTKAFGIRPGFDFHQTDPYLDHADYFLFDTGSSKPGGTGEKFDWNVLDEYKGETSFFLSGGLSPNTLILPDHPRMIGVDLNSRFETIPGIKDIALLKTFLKQSRNE